MSSDTAPETGFPNPEPPAHRRLALAVPMPAPTLLAVTLPDLVIPSVAPPLTRLVS